MATINNTELLPCPFCGSTEQILKPSHDHENWCNWLTLSCKCGVSIDSDNVNPDFFVCNEEMPDDHPAVPIMINVWNNRA
jgi:hypothetical protein